MRTLAAREARLLLLAGCGLARAPRPATAATVLRTVRELGFVQVDSIAAVERAHHLILHARHDGYTHAHLAHILERSRQAFEHWTHDASVIRADWLPWWTHRFETSRARLAQSTWMRERLGSRWRSTVREVRAALEERGPLASRDFPRPPCASEGWWDWSPHKAALEYLWRAGEVAVHSRRGFEKLYDLAERVHGPMPAPPAREELVAWACRAAIERLGAGTPREFAQFMHAVTVEEARAWCAGASARGEVEPVLLERIGRASVAGYANPRWKRDAEAVEPDPTPRLLAPFDPLIRDRARLLGLFAFDYRFEAFVPAARRVHGYYTMPVLAGERLVARVDLSSDRAEGVLRVARTWPEAGVSGPAAKRATLAACERLATQLALSLQCGGRRGAR